MPVITLLKQSEMEDHICNHDTAEKIASYQFFGTFCVRIALCDVYVYTHVYALHVLIIEKEVPLDGTLVLRQLANHSDVLVEPREKN